MSEDLLIDLLQREYDEYCQKILPSEKPYRFRTRRHDDGSTHIEIKGDEYHLVVTERGSELSRSATTSKEELMYRLVSDLAWATASDYEARNRLEGRDFRRMLFAKWRSYLKAVNPKWAKRCEEEIGKILQRSPYNDGE